MKVAAIQFDVVREIKQNRASAEKFIREAAAQQADLIMLPELWHCGYQLERIEEIAETLHGESIGLLRALAKELDVTIIGGSIAEKRDGKYFNTCAVIDNNGEIKSKYRKVHLYPHGLCEPQTFTAGDEWSFTEFDGARIGLMICYDVEFPEFARNLCLRGAEILSLPGEWPSKIVGEWRILCKARAVENHSYLISANCSDSTFSKDAQTRVGGHSMIISPYGEVLAEAGDEETVIYAEINAAVVRGLRARRNSMDDRRRILDEIDDSQL